MASRLDPSAKILVTGATGYIGALVARQLMAKGYRVVLPVRASDESAFDARELQLRQNLGVENREQCQVLWASLDDREQLASLPLDVQAIIHCAAVTRFNVSEDEANRNNREGSRNLFAYARKCRELRTLQYVSTVYVAGESMGKVPESLLPQPPAFANHYERSKWETEELLSRDFDDLPWNILRVATIICDDDSGVTGQLNAVHNTLKLFYYGLISLIPGQASTPVYLVTGKFVAAGIVAATESQFHHEVVHLCHGREQCLTLGELIDESFAAFLQDEGFRQRGIQKPLFVDEESFELVTEGVKGFGGSVLTEALGSVAPFAKQLFLDKDFAHEKIGRIMQDVAAPEPRALLRQLVLYLRESRWGRGARG